MAEDAGLTSGLSRRHQAQPQHLSRLAVRGRADAPHVGGGGVAQLEPSRQKHATRCTLAFFPGHRVPDAHGVRRLVGGDPKLSGNGGHHRPCRREAGRRIEGFPGLAASELGGSPVEHRSSQRIDLRLHMLSRQWHGRKRQDTPPKRVAPGDGHFHDLDSARRQVPPNDSNTASRRDHVAKVEVAEGLRRVVRRREVVGPVVESDAQNPATHVEHGDGVPAPCTGLAPSEMEHMHRLRCGCSSRPAQQFPGRRKPGTCDHASVGQDRPDRRVRRQLEDLFGESRPRVPHIVAPVTNPHSFTVDLCVAGRAEVGHSLGRLERADHRPAGKPRRHCGVGQRQPADFRVGDDDSQASAVHADCCARSVAGGGRCGGARQPVGGAKLQPGGPGLVLRGSGRRQEPRKRPRADPAHYVVPAAARMRRRPTR